MSVLNTYLNGTFTLKPKLGKHTLLYVLRGLRTSLFLPQICEMYVRIYEAKKKID